MFLNKLLFDFYVVVCVNIIQEGLLASANVIMCQPLCHSRNCLA